MKQRTIVFLGLPVFAIGLLSIFLHHRSRNHIQPATAHPERGVATERCGIDNALRARFAECFDASLEMREHAEFILAPALLVQEVTSEQTILTFSGK